MKTLYVTFTLALFAILLLGSFAAKAQVKTEAPVALVYNGDGACPEGCAKAAAEVAIRLGFVVRAINAGNWQERAFQGAQVWIQPGGKSHLVAKALSHEQKERLRRFVASGGGYVGFCAGGFFASQTVKGDESAQQPVEMLNLVPLQSALYQNEADALILPIQWAGIDRFLYWEGGPYFVTDTPPLAPSPAIEVVARYPEGQAVTLKTTYGRGRVFVTGLHPEAPQFWRDYYHLTDPDGLDTDLAGQMIQWVSENHD